MTSSLTHSLSSAEVAPTTSEGENLQSKLWLELEQRIDPSQSSWRWRESLWLKAKRIGLPTAKNQAYSGVRLKAFDATSSDSVVLADLALSSNQTFATLGDQAEISLLDGKQVRSSDSLSLIALKQAHKLGPIASNRYMQLATSEQDPWALINGALADEALWGRVAEDFKGKITIEFKTETASYSFPRLTLWIGKRANVVIELISNGLGEGLSVELIDLIQETNSHVELVWSRRSSKTARSLHFVRASLKKEATFLCSDLSQGALISRLDLHVQLLEEQAKTELFGLSLLEGKNHSMINVLVEHIAPHCQSSQLFKTALKESSKNLFRGKIYVFPEAQKSLAYQISRNLLLSDRAQAQSMPNLEIFADDVKASHGSTTGQIDQEALFYLRARGIDEQAAKALLVHGFSLEVLEKLQNGSLKAVWKSVIDNF